MGVVGLINTELINKLTWVSVEKDVFYLILLSWVEGDWITHRLHDFSFTTHLDGDNEEFGAGFLFYGVGDWDYEYARMYHHVLHLLVVCRHNLHQLLQVLSVFDEQFFYSIYFHQPITAEEFSWYYPDLQLISKQLL